MMVSKLKLLAVVLGVVFIMPMLVSVGAPDSVMANTVVAQEKKEPKYKDVKTRKRQSVGKSCAKALDRVQGEKGPISMASEADEKANVMPLWVEAKQMLLDIDSRPKTCSTDYEKTQVWNMLGYVAYSLDDFKGAIRYYRLVVDGIGTPPELKLDTRYTLAQFYAMQEQYALAVIEMEIWIDAAIIVGADARMLLAQLYYQLERKADALAMVEIAIAESEAKAILPKESMWSLQRVLYYEKDDLKKVTSILQKLVKHYPKWTYWKQLGGMYGSQERETDQLVATEMVYLNDQLTTESQVMSMAYMYLGAEVPYRAARIIEKGMKDEIIEKTAKNLEVLGQAWWQAKNLESALKSFEEASKYSDTGEIQSRIASIYLDLGKDKQAYKAAQKAAKKGDIKNTSTNYATMGSALINLHCYKDAVKAFNKSVKTAKTKKAKRYPSQWIKFANAEGSRLQKLRDVGATVPGCSKA
jgi:tetratricopeptide (TPR) repeat protein